MGWGVVYPSPLESKTPYVCACGAEHDEERAIEQCDIGGCCGEICGDCSTRCKSCKYQTCQEHTVVMTTADGTEQTYCTYCAKNEGRYIRMEKASLGIDGLELLARAISVTGNQYVDRKISHEEMSDRFRILHKLRWAVRSEIVGLAGHREEAA
jgi:hypothetical protein